MNENPEKLKEAREKYQKVLLKRAEIKAKKRQDAMTIEDVILSLDHDESLELFYSSSEEEYVGIVTDSDGVKHYGYDESSVLFAARHALATFNESAVR